MAVVPFSAVVRDTVAQYSLFVWLAALLVALGALSYWMVTSGVKRQAEAVVDEDPANYPQAPTDGRPAAVYLFHVDWCGFCTKAKPVWETFKKTFDGRSVNAHRVSCIDINVTGSDGGDHAVDGALAQQYNLKSYPTVKIVLDGKKVVTLNSSVTDDSLRSFLQDCTKRASYY